MTGLKRSVLPCGIWSCCTWSIHGVSAIEKHNTKPSHMANLLLSAKEKHTNKTARNEPPSPSPSLCTSERLFVKTHRCLHGIIITQPAQRCWWGAERKRWLFFSSPWWEEKRVGGIYTLRGWERAWAVCDGEMQREELQSGVKGLGKGGVELAEGKSGAASWGERCGGLAGSGFLRVSYP